MTQDQGDPNKVATIYDIARVAQVSPSTVSRALSTPGRLNAKTEARIRQTAKDLNYQLNPLARALPTGRSHMLGVLVSDLTNPVFFDMVRGADRSAQAAGNTMMLSESQELAEREGHAARRMLGVVDGLVLSSSRQTDQEIQDLAEIKPLVLVNRVVPGVLSIVPDLSPGITSAVTKIKAAGYQDITYLAGPEHSWMNGARLAALQDSAQRAGITVTVVASEEPTIAGGARLLPRLSSAGLNFPGPNTQGTKTQRPNALDPNTLDPNTLDPNTLDPNSSRMVMAFNDLMAIGLMRAAVEAGISVPGQLNIIGFDDIFGADFTSPQLSTIKAPLGELGERAVVELLSLIDRSNQPAGPLEIPYGATKFVARGSASLEISPTA